MSYLLRYLISSYAVDSKDIRSCIATRDLIDFVTDFVSHSRRIIRVFMSHDRETFPMKIQ